MTKVTNPNVFLMLAVATLLGGGAFVVSQATGVAAYKERVAKMTQETENEAKVRSRLADSEQALQEAAAKLQHLEQNMPTAAYVPTMLQELEKFGKERGIKVIGVRPAVKTASKPRAEGESLDKAAKPYDELDIEVKGRGNYDSIEGFVKSLQSFPKIVAARMVSVIPYLDPMNPGEPQLEAIVELRAYLFKQAEKPQRAEEKKA